MVMPNETGRAAGWRHLRDEEPAAVPFGASFVKSEAFKELFRDGMALVEETASYLDGDGRLESNRLGRSTALAYASESMRLTTRLMQIASWLLVQRAVAEGEITTVQALREKERVKLVAQDVVNSDLQFATLPERIRELVAQSLRLHARIMHLEGLITAGDRPAATAAPGPVAQQLMLRSIFEVA